MDHTTVSKRNSDVENHALSATGSMTNVIKSVPPTGKEATPPPPVAEPIAGTSQESSDVSVRSINATGLQRLYTAQCKRVRELLESNDAKEARISQLETEIGQLQHKSERWANEARRYKDDVQSYRYEIEWKTQRIAFLESQLTKFDPTGDSLSMKADLHLTSPDADEDDTDDDAGHNL